MRLILRSCFTVGFSALAALALGSASIAGAVPAGGAVQARLSADLRPLAAPPTSVIYGPACPDVMVIAARGTGEAPSPDWQDLSAYVSDPNHGAGATLFSLYTDMNNANGLTFSLDPVVYPVAPPTSSLTNPLGVLIHSSQQYLGDAAIGTEGIALASIFRACDVVAWGAGPGAIFGSR